MKILTALEYNKQAENKYGEACKNWKMEDGGFPQAAFYFFSTRDGNFRRYGYVASGDHKAYWNKTKKGAIEMYHRYALGLPR